MLQFVVALAVSAVIGLAMTHGQARGPVSASSQPVTTCATPLPDPALNAIALQASDLPNGWQILITCIVTPPSNTPGALPSLQQDLLNLGATANPTPSAYGTGPITADILARNYPSESAANAAFPAFVADAHHPAIDLAAVSEPGQTPSVPPASVQTADLPAPAIGDDAAALTIQVSESYPGMTQTYGSTDYLARRGRTLFSVNVSGGSARDTIALQISQALDTRVQAVQAAGE